MSTYIKHHLKTKENGWYNLDSIVQTKWRKLSVDDWYVRHLIGELMNIRFALPLCGKYCNHNVNTYC